MDWCNNFQPFPHQISLLFLFFPRTLFWMIFALFKSTLNCFNSRQRQRNLILSYRLTITGKCLTSIRVLELLVVVSVPHPSFKAPESSAWEPWARDPSSSAPSPLVWQPPATPPYQCYRTRCWWMCSCGKMCCWMWHPRNNTPQTGNPQRSLTSDAAQWTWKTRMVRGTSPPPHPLLQGSFP